MNDFSDVGSIGGGGALVGWAFLLIFLIGGMIYKTTTAAERASIGNTILLIAFALAMLGGLINIATYLFSKL